jgi:hypothetical protein
MAREFGWDVRQGPTVNVSPERTRAIDLLPDEVELVSSYNTIDTALHARFAAESAASA